VGDIDALAQKNGPAEGTGIGQTLVFRAVLHLESVILDFLSLVPGEEETVALRNRETSARGVSQVDVEIIVGDVLDLVVIDHTHSVEVDVDVHLS
jgi:hypothetical protein